MKVLEFARSSIFFRIDLDTIVPKTLSHEPPYRMNNARIPIDAMCRVTEQATGRVSTFVLGGDCKTERVGATADLFLEPNADFIPIFSDDSFMHIKTFARAGTVAQAYPPGSGEQGDRLVTKVADTFDRVHLDLVERDGELLSSGERHRRRGARQRHARREPTGSRPTATRRRSSTRSRRSTPTSGTSSTRPTPARSSFRTWIASRPSCLLAWSSRSPPRTQRTGRSSSSARAHRSPTASRSTTTRDRSGWTVSRTTFYRIAAGAPESRRRVQLPAGA